MLRDQFRVNPVTSDAIQATIVSRVVTHVQELVGDLRGHFRSSAAQYKLRILIAARSHSISSYHRARLIKGGFNIQSPHPALVPVRPLSENISNRPLHSRARNDSGINVTTMRSWIDQGAFLPQTKQKSFPPSWPGRWVAGSAGLLFLLVVILGRGSDQWNWQAANQHCE